MIINALQKNWSLFLLTSILTTGAVLGQSNTTIQWQSPNPGLDNALEDPDGSLILTSANWYVQMYIDSAGDVNNTMNALGFPTTQTGSSMSPQITGMTAPGAPNNPLGGDLPVLGTGKAIVSTFVAGSFFEFLSPAGDPPYNYDFVEGQNVYTVIFNASTIEDATAWAIVDDTPFSMPNQPPLPNPELPTVNYIFGTLPQEDWVATVPEPTGVVLSGMALLFSLGLRRRH